MNLWIIAGIIAGLFVFIGIVAATITNVDAESRRENLVSCSSDYDNSCTSQSNCGLADCRAVYGESCGCR